MARHHVMFKIKDDTFIFGNKMKVKRDKLENIFFSKQPVILNKIELSKLKDIVINHNISKKYCKNIFTKSILF